MNFLRTTSTRRLIAGSALSVALVAGGVAAAMAAGGGGTPPPAKPLDAGDPRCPGGARSPRASPRACTSRTTSSRPARSRRGSPLLTGANGRLWLSATAGAPRAAVRRRRRADHRRRRERLGLRRLEQHGLQGAAPGGRTATTAGTEPHGVPTIGRDLLGPRRSSHSTRRSRAPSRRRMPASPPTSSRVTPKHDAGLLGAGRDRLGCGQRRAAAHLHLAAAGSSSPVLALDVTDISYGSVDVQRARDLAAGEREGRRPRHASHSGGGGTPSHPEARASPP